MSKIIFPGASILDSLLEVEVDTLAVSRPIYETSFVVGAIFVYYFTSAFYPVIGEFSSIHDIVGESKGPFSMEDTFV